jgi:hypothetical protein
MKLASMHRSISFAYGDVFLGAMRLSCNFVSFVVKKMEKLADVKLIWKLLINTLLEISIIIIDHKKQENEGL